MNIEIENLPFKWPKGILTEFGSVLITLMVKLGVKHMESYLSLFVIDNWNRKSAWNISAY
jgi:hypothetical protein